MPADTVWIPAARSAHFETARLSCFCFECIVGALVFVRANFCPYKAFVDIPSLFMSLQLPVFLNKHELDFERHAGVRA